MSNVKNYHYCRIVEESQSSPVTVEEIAVSFFSLLETILRAENLASTSMVRTHHRVSQTIITIIKLITVLTIHYDACILISQLEEKVQIWQSSPASSLNVWFSSVSCWSDLVLQALQFLAGETKGG